MNISTQNYYLNGQSLNFKNTNLVFNNTIFSKQLISNTFKPIFSIEFKNYFFEKKYYFKNSDDFLWEKYKIKYSIKLYNDIKKKLIPAFKINIKVYNLINNKFFIFYKQNNNYLIQYSNLMPYIYYKLLDNINFSFTQKESTFIFELGKFVDLGEPISTGNINIQDLLDIFFNYHLFLDSLILSVIKSSQKLELILVNSIQAIYESQGVIISSKHIELIIYQMFTKVLVLKKGNTPFFIGEFINKYLMFEIYNTLKAFSYYSIPEYKPVLQSITKQSTMKSGFLASISFQNTKQLLLQASIQGTSDWFRSLKESIIVGRTLPAGVSFLNYKKTLNSIYLFKNT